MATIMYSMCGEGRGHATRVQAIVEMMVPHHRFILLAARDAYHQLYTHYQDHPFVRVRRLPGLFFAYRGRKVDYASSVLASVPYLWRLESMVKYLCRMIERDKPDLAITDFEPLLPRAAKRSNVRWVSLDHQHFLSVSDFHSMPWNLRTRGWMLRSSISLFYRGQEGEAVSSFYHLPPRRGTESIPRIGVLLRPAVLRARDEHQKSNGHLLVYVRRHAPDSLWKAIDGSGRKALVYGLGTRENIGNIEFRPLSDETFVRDLATSECLITTAGNQLVGEAHFLRKPVLAIPEEGNFEQQLNGWLVTKSGGGWCTSFGKLTPHYLQQFLLAVPGLRNSIRQENVCGNRAAYEFICQHLPHSETLSETVPFESNDVWESSQEYDLMTPA